MKTKKGTSAVDSDLEAMRAKFKKQKARREGGEEEKTALWDDLQLGKNMRRILPREGSKQFFTEAAIHYRVGPDNKAIRCIGTLSEEGWPADGTACPVCRRFHKERAQVNRDFPTKGDAAGREAYRKAKDAWFPRVRYYMNVLREDGSVRILSAGEQIMGQLLEYYFEEDSEVGDFTSVEDGRWINVKRTGKGAGDRLTKYIVKIGDATTALDNWDEVQPLMHDLEKAAGVKLDADTIKKIIEGSALDEDSDDAEDEDEEEKPAVKAKAAKVAAKDDEDDEDEDDEDDEDEDEDDVKVHAKPACYGDPDDHDPKDPTCQECGFRAACAKEPEVAEKLAQLAKRKAKAAR